LNNANRLVFCESGTSAVEFGIILSVFVSMMFGILNISIVLWTLGSLHYAAETAARCAAVGSASCTDPAAYALSQYYGVSLGATNPFSYNSPTAGCGHTVTASYTYSLVIPMIGSYSLPLAAAACSP
jgi:Flp pilus assembly protein TadG